MNDNNDGGFTIPVEIEQYERKIYDLKQLIEISKGLNSTLEYNTLIDSILLTCMGQMQLLKAGIFLKKGIGFENYSLHRNYKGFEIDHSIEYDIRSDSALIRFLARNFKCYPLDELEESVDDQGSLMILKALDPTLVVPLVSKGIINGIIILGDRINSKGFTESEKEYLLNIGSLAGIAIHNAFLYEMATTDMMTKLKSHHYFHSIIIEEMERARNNRIPLTLLMIDVDNFEKFNDTHGHSAGDAVLIHVAKLIKDCVRQIDIAARYGGEEFAVILPKTDINLGLIVAERIRHTIEHDGIIYEDKKLTVTISIGLSQYDPAMDMEKKSLIERADKAMYMSKAGGKNMVTIL